MSGMLHIAKAFRRSFGWLWCNSEGCLTGEDVRREQLQLEGMLQKHWDAVAEGAQGAVKEEIAELSPKLSSAFFYGATGIHPKHLVLWYLFATDAELAQAKDSGLTELIRRRSCEELKARGYLIGAIPEVLVSFTTDEGIQRETGGDSWAYFK